MLTVLGGLAEFERSLILARTSDGRTRAKAKGVKFGWSCQAHCASATRSDAAAQRSMALTDPWQSAKLSSRLGAANAYRSIEEARVHHPARRRGGGMALRRVRSSPECRRWPLAPTPQQPPPAQSLRTVMGLVLVSPAGEIERNSEAVLVGA